MRFAPRALAVLALAVAFVAPAAPATASDGSVPPDVIAYVSGGGLVERLEQIYGENHEGDGIPFDETTTPGPISRVFHWTDARLAGDTSGKSTRMVNEWATPITLAGEPVGVALLWINTETERPELAEFQPGADAAVALAAVPENARLVRDLGSEAWFAVADGTLTPLVPGRSGITTPMPLDAAALASPVPAATPDASTANGVWIAFLALGLLGTVVVVGLLLPGRARRADSASADNASDNTDTPEV